MRNFLFFLFVGFTLFSTLTFSSETEHHEPPPPPVEEDSWAILLYFHGTYLSIDQDTFFHVLIEVSLIVFILYLVFQRSYKPGEPEKLTPKEIETLIEEWVPEPLVTPDSASVETIRPVVSSTAGQYVTVDGKELLNFGTGNFLGLTQHPAMKEVALAAIKKYGVGTCGPRGFYGTIDTHLDLEKKLAEYMDSEEAVIYSSGFNTISSVISAFSGREDIILCDNGCSFGVQLGVQLSRSEVHYFKHNDLEDLERLMKQVKEKDSKTKRKLTKRFILVEGVYQNFGDICPLDKIVELRKKYCYRIILEDSVGLGTMGRRGTLDHFNIHPREVAVYTASMANSLGSVGGFVTGSFQVGYHQRLNSVGYVFSASPPPYLVVAAQEALKIIEQTPELYQSLQEKSVLFRQTLKEHLTNVPVEIGGYEKSPLIHLRLQNGGSKLVTEKALQQIVQKCAENGMCVTFANYCDQKDQFIPPPSIKIYLNVCLTTENLKTGATVLSEAVKKVLEQSS